MKNTKILEIENSLEEKPELKDIFNAIIGVVDKEKRNNMINVLLQFIDELKITNSEDKQALFDKYIKLYV